MMRLFTLFISYRSGHHYCGVYPSLEYLHDVIVEMARDEGLTNAGDEIPDLEKIRRNLEDPSHDDFWHAFQNGMWIHVQEVSDQLVEVILTSYFETFYLDLAARIDLKVASLPKDKVCPNILLSGKQL